MGGEKHQEMHLLGFYGHYRNRREISNPTSWPLVFGGNELESAIAAQFLPIECVCNDDVARVQCWINFSQGI
jgi:hypothetical protein